MPTFKFEDQRIEVSMMLDNLPSSGIDSRLIKNWEYYGPLTVK